MKSSLIKMIFVIMVMLILGGCDHSVSSTNQLKNETDNGALMQTSVESDGCDDNDVTIPTSPLQSIKAQGCPINEP